jgi:hypothetical protein
MKEKVEQLKKDSSWKEKERRRLAQILGNVKDEYKIDKIIARISNLLDNKLSELEQAVKEEIVAKLKEIKNPYPRDIRKGGDKSIYQFQNDAYAQALIDVTNQLKELN